MNSRIEVAVELAALDDLVGVTGAVELELVHAIFLEHRNACVAKVAIVFWARQCETSFVGLESLRTGRGEALLFGPIIAAPRREPDAGRSADFGRGLRHLR